MTQLFFLLAWPLASRYRNTITVGEIITVRLLEDSFGVLSTYGNLPESFRRRKIQKPKPRLNDCLYIRIDTHRHTDTHTLIKSFISGAYTYRLDVIIPNRDLPPDLAPTYLGRYLPTLPREVLYLLRYYLSFWVQSPWALGHNLFYFSLVALPS